MTVDYEKGVAMSKEWLYLAAGIAAAAVPFAVHSDAFKCTTPSGKVVITDSGCAGVGKHSGAYGSEYISPERQRQAMDVDRRNMNMLERSAAEDAAYRESLARQQEAYRASQRPVAQPVAPVVVIPQQERAPRRRSPAPGQITNCDQAGCWDTNGNRYNNGAGGTKFRADGKVCNQVGAELICH